MTSRRRNYLYSKFQTHFSLSFKQSKRNYSKHFALCAGILKLNTYMGILPLSFKVNM